MGKGFRHGNGGMNPLNYTVVGNPQPASPRENTIWVNTDVKITDHVFGINEPEKVEGRVWIYTGFHSMAAANVLKKNTLMVYPQNCRQVVGGAWTEKPAMTYIGGEWVEWTTYLFKDGITNLDLVGEWMEVGNALLMNDGSMTIKGGAWNGSVCTGVMYSKNAIDLTHFKTLEYVVEDILNPSTYAYSPCVYSELPTSALVETVVSRKIAEAGTFFLDISSLSGFYYVGFKQNALDYGVPESVVSRISMR